jgi:hypothetical protein
LADTTVAPILDRPVIEKILIRLGHEPQAPPEAPERPYRQRP